MTSIGCKGQCGRRVQFTFSVSGDQLAAILAIISWAKFGNFWYCPNCGPK